MERGERGTGSSGPEKECSRRMRGREGNGTPWRKWGLGGLVRVGGTRDGGC